MYTQTHNNQPHNVLQCSLRSHLAAIKISYGGGMLNRSLLNLGLYRPIQPLVTCLACFAFSCPSISCLDILMVRHFYVRHFQRPTPYALLTSICCGPVGQQAVTQVVDSLWQIPSNLCNKLYSTARAQVKQGSK